LDDGQWDQWRAKFDDVRFVKTDIVTLDLQQAECLHPHHAQARSSVGHGHLKA